MSSFINYYEDLQVSPTADLETIERVYRLFAKRYHPDNPNTGDGTKFTIISTAYKTLCDHEKRAAYDVRFEEYQARRWAALSNPFAVPDNTNSETIRLGILSVLLQQRKQDPANPDMGLWHMERMIGWPEKTLEFHIWYMQEKEWIRRSDTGQYMITATGVDIIEQMQAKTTDQPFLIEN